MPDGLASPMVELRQVHKHYPGQHVLKGIDLRVGRGEVLVIIGPSGSGKFSLLRCVNAIEPVTSGEVLVEGESITGRKADLNRLRRRVGMVFQQFNLFPHLSALDNVTLAPRRVLGMNRKVAETRAGELLERGGMAGRGADDPFQLSG